MDTSDVTASGCSRNTIAVKIYYPTRRPNEAKTNKLLKNERGAVKDGGESESNRGGRGHAGVYNRKMKRKS